MNWPPTEEQFAEIAEKASNTDERLKLQNRIKVYSYWDNVKEFTKFPPSPDMKIQDYKTMTFANMMPIDYSTEDDEPITFCREKDQIITVFILKKE